MKSFKCANCGSTKYVQIQEDKYKCAYCEAEFEFLSAEKSAFEKNLSAQKLKKGVKVYKASLTEEEFRKNALIQLSMNKNTPLDILEKANFDYVNYNYVFFASFDICYYELVQNAIRDVDSKTVSLADSQMARFITRINKCIPLSSDCLVEQNNLIIKDFQNDELDRYSATIGFGKDEKIVCPEKSVVESGIETMAEKMKAVVKQGTEVFEVMYKVENVQIFAVPEYSLSYKYNSETYKLSSFAHKLNIVGTMPNSKDIKKLENKKAKPINLITMVICLAMISFSLLHLAFFKFYRFLTLDIVLFVVSIGMLIFNLLINKNIDRLVKREWFGLKRESLIAYMSKSDVKTTSNDKEFINSFFCLL